MSNVPARVSPWPVVVPALLAAIVSAYLTVTSLSASLKPVGCGAGSGCEEVLSSRWSKVLGIPVGLPAAGLYLVVVVAAVARSRTADSSMARGCSGLLWVSAGAILAAVHWFIGLQWIHLGVFCPWCLIDHGLGLITALAILITEVGQHRFRPLRFFAGMGLTGTLVLLQIVLPGAGPSAAPLSTRQVELLEGRLRLDLGDVPSLGSPDAPQQIVVLFDYCCPHCRHTHAELLSALKRAPQAFSLVVLPTPLNADCNPHIDETEEKFLAACDLARLALAVWREDRERFADFDRWLFESETARTADEARVEAERLVGAAALARALSDEWIAQRIRADVDAFQESGVDAIPVLLAPGRGGVSGRVADSAAMEQLLRDAFGVELK